jgi:hypothetical protein
MVCGRNGEWRTWPADRLLNGRYWPEGYPDGATYIWNPIGAGSWGQYYTNGLYVTSWGQHILPGTSSLVAVVSPPAPQAPDSGAGDEGDGGDTDSELPESVSTTTTTIAEVLGARSTALSPSLVATREVGLVVQKMGKKYRIAITSPTQNSPVVVKATAKGKRTITWSAKTNINARKFLFSTRSLQGYNISLWVNGRKLSSIKAG